jgi:hypothetical protein
MHSTVGGASAEALSQQLTAQVQQVVAEFAALLGTGPQPLDALEQAVLARLKPLGNTLLAGLCQLQAPAYPAAQVACACGGVAVYQRQRLGQCKTLLGTLTLKRAYYCCAQCQQGCYPLDRQLGFCAGSISAGLDELLALLGCQFSFAHSAALVQRLSLVEVSASRCRKSTERVGQQVAQAEEAQRQQVWEQPTPYQPPACAQPIDPVYISADGVMVHTRETGWREQCVGAVYTTQQRRTQQRRTHLRSHALSYVTDLGSRAAFGQQLWLEAQRRGVEQAQQVVFIGDGAPWLWEMAHDLFPQALQILDWYHASSYLWTVAHEVHPKDALAAQRWAEQQLALLAQSQTDQVLGCLEPLATTLPAARTALTYLTNNRSRIDYARYRQRGLQIGSGTIESACNHLITQRLKQAGMRWKLDNARTVGKLRARLKSGRWQETLSLHPPPCRGYRRRPLPA